MGTLTGCIAEVQKAYAGVAEAEAVVDDVLELSQTMGFDGQAATDQLLTRARAELAGQEAAAQPPAPVPAPPAAPAPQEPIREAPPGLRQVATTYMNGVVVPVFAPFGQLQRVKHKTLGYMGVIDSFFGNQLQLPDQAIVKWEGLGAVNKAKWSELEAAPARFKVGDEVAWIEDDFGTRRAARWTRIVEVSDVNGVRLYTIINSNFSGDSVQSGAFDGELEPLSSHPQLKPPVADTPRGKKQLEASRDQASSTLRGMVDRARAEGAPRLAARLDSIGVKRNDGGSGFPPADIKMLAERIDGLIEREQANPDEKWADLRPGIKPKVPKLTAAEREWRDKMARLAVHYTPGNIVRSYGGFDRVLEFRETGSRGSWEVKVQAVRKVGDRWVPEVEGGREASPRWHSTWPDAREFAEGPIERAPPADLLAQPDEDPELAKAKQDMLDALGDLGDILSKGTRKNILSPEQEQKLMPVLVRLFDAAFRIGKIKFVDAARFVLEKIAAALGQDVADQISLENLQGAYIGMSGRYRERGAEGMMQVAQVQTKDQLKETSDAADRPDGVEPGGPAGEPGVAPPVRDDAGPDGDGARGPGARSGGAGRGARRGPGLRGNRPAPAGEDGDQGLPEEAPQDDGVDPAAGDSERGPDGGDSGVQAESLSDQDVEEFARRETASDLDRRRAQREAEGIAVVENDPDNIRATLPMLLPKQQDDVIFAERRLTEPEGYGVVFTNGTGTGKTFTGLGVIKRYVKRGRTNILIVVPNDPVMQGWIKAGPALGLTITPLASTKDAGRGVSITTYANLGDNNELVKRRWDLLVGDESQNFSSNEPGDINIFGEAFRALSLHPDGAHVRTRMKYPELAAQIDELSAEEAKAAKARDLVRMNIIGQQLAPLLKRWNAHMDDTRVEIADAQGLARPRALFLSATPFAYEKSVRFYNGYLYDWNKDHVDRGYRQPSAYDAFMIRHFGYRWRNAKLTQPSKEVNRGLMQRSFNTWLKSEGSLSGRNLDSPFDYDRRFVAANSEIGMRIDEAFAWFREQDEAELADRLVMPDDSDELIKVEPAQKVASALRRVRAALGKKFDYHSRIRLLEALKAEASVDYIRAHLELGRKVIVFHDRIKGQDFDPFTLNFSEEENPVEAQVYELWRRAFADLTEYDWNSLKRPIQVMHEAFGGDTVEVNGTRSDTQNRAAMERFNDDSSGPMVMVVQSDKDSGWSAHDITGNFPRVVINLGLPTRPVKSIQQEGRIYRVGQASNAMFRYFNTRTNWERAAFAQTIAQRASAAENLAMGEEARGLMDAYIDAFEETDDWAPGFEGEGTGGKERDRQAAQLLSEWDRAKSLYWSQLAKTSRTKAQEGTDYFATPEPIGLKMVEWGDARPSETMAEPSAGHGAIARWFPEDMESWAVEPSEELNSRLGLAYFGKIRKERFESVHAVNKADVMAMNPPYGVGGKLAYEHLTKAYNDHLQIGGRIVALMPTGPAADARLEKFLTGSHEDTRPSREVFKSPVGPVHHGDTITWNVFGHAGQDQTGEFVQYHDDGRVTAMRSGGSESTFWANQIVGVKPGPRKARAEPLIVHPRLGPIFKGDVLEGESESLTVVRIENAEGAFIGTRAGRSTEVFERLSFMKRVVPGPRAGRMAPIAPGAHVVATIKLPRVTFKRAGTEVATHILVIDKLDKDQVGPGRIDIDLSGLDTIEELFDELENLSVPERTKPRPVETEDSQPADAAARPQKPAKAESAADGEALAASVGLEVVDYTTKSTGKQLRGVMLRHVSASVLKQQLPAAGAFQLREGAFVRIDRLKAVLDKFPLPPVAREERAVYAVREPDANYDLFDDPILTSPRGDPPRRRAARGVVPAANALSVRADPFFPGVYHATSQLVEVSRRELPVTRVTDWPSAAAALSSLSRWAVEHFDALVTDANGRPLALIGSFKGAPAQTSVYPATVLMEALRIEGAAAVWGVHNHPSGSTELSRADEFLSGTLDATFRPSAVRWMGLAAVGKDGQGTVRFSATQPDGARFSGIVVPSNKTSLVPVVERTIMERPESPKPGDSVDSARKAKDIAVSLLGAKGKARLLLLNAQHYLTGYIDLDPETAGNLAGNGRFDRLINSASEAGAQAVIVANPGGALNDRQLANLASAFKLADVRLLDVIDPLTGASLAERGLDPPTSLPVLSGGTTATPVNPQALRTAVTEVAVSWSRNVDAPRVFVVDTADQLPADVQAELRRMRALRSTRGLMMPDGRTYLIADQIGSVEDGIKVLFHEVYGHFGLRAFLGDSYMVQMTALRVANPKLAAEADAWHKRNGKDQVEARIAKGMSPERAEAVVKALAVEEALSDRAGDAPVPKAWRVVMARLQRALREMGEFGRVVADWLESMTEAETFWLLAQARAAVQQGVHANRSVDTAQASRRPPRVAGDVPQEISSAATSRRQVPAAMHKIAWAPGTINADIGAGRFSDATAFLASKGVDNLEFDPFNRSSDENVDAVTSLAGRRADTATALNVLNVIKEPEARDNVIRRTAKAIKDDGVAYFQTYEGDGSGVPAASRDGWQENRKTESYIAEIGRHFGQVVRRGQIIEARQPIRQPGDSWTTDEGDVLFSRTASRPGRRSNVDKMTLAEMQREIADLMPRVQSAYEGGNDSLAVRLDGRLEALMANMEASLLEIEEDMLDMAYRGFNRATLIQEGEQGDSEADLVIDMANRWNELTTRSSHYFEPDDAARAASLRALLEDYAHRHGGLKAGLTDAAVLEAARDAHGAVFGMRQAQAARAKLRGASAALSRTPEPPQGQLRPISARMPSTVTAAPFSAFDLLNTMVETPIRLAATPLHATRRMLAPGVTDAARKLDAALDTNLPGYEYVKAGVVDKYGLSDAYGEAKLMRQTAIRVNWRKTKDVVDKLRALSFEQSRIAYLWMSVDKNNPELPDREAIEAAHRLFDALPDESKQLLRSLKEDIHYMGKEAVRLGLVSQESFERNEYFYLHRSYHRHIKEEAEAAHLKSQSARILGDVSKKRGMRYDASMAEIAHTDWWERKTKKNLHDPSLKGQKFHRLELRDSVPDTDTPQLFEDENGQKMGRLREVVFWPVDEPIPARFGDWRNDGVWEARFFDKSQKVGMFRDFSLAERTKMGEVQEVRYAVATTLMLMTRDIETAKFLDWVARNESVAAPEAGGRPLIPEGHTVVDGASRLLTRSYKTTEWVRVPDDMIRDTGIRRFGRLAGRYVPGPVWNDLRQIAEFSDPASLTAIWDWTMRAWKIAKTALSPVTHLNNVMGNLMFADMHDIQARHLHTALAAMVTKGKDPAMKRLIEDFEDNGGDAGMFNQAELRNELMEPLLDELRLQVQGEGQGRALVTAASILSLATNKKYREAMVALKEHKGTRALTWTPRMMIELYGLEDQVFRLAAFVKAREDGLSDNEAGKFARASFLNYEINAPWINALRRTVLPFVAFVYRGAPMIAKTFVDKPEKAIKYAIIAGGFNMLAYAMLGLDGDDEDRERAWLQDEKDGYIWGFLTPRLIRMPWNDRNGNPVFLDVRRWVPMGDVVDTGQAQSSIPLPPPMLPGGPGVILAELFGNKSWFTGREITLETDTLATKAEKSFEHLWKGMMPNFPGLPGTYSTDMLVDTAYGRVHAGPFGQERTGWSQAIPSVFGIKLASYPTEVLRAQREFEWTTARREAAREFRSALRLVDRMSKMDPKAQEAERQRAEQVFNEKIARINEAEDRAKRLAGELR